MKRLATTLAAAVIVASAVACSDNNDVAGSRGSLAAVNVDAPSFAQSGVEFGVEISRSVRGNERLDQRQFRDLGPGHPRFEHALTSSGSNPCDPGVR
jgi:hypothetical protein